MTDPEACKGDVVFPDGYRGGLPLLHRGIHHTQFVAKSIVPLGFPREYNSAKKAAANVSAESSI
jgi:hypothetical protein